MSKILKVLKITIASIIGIYILFCIGVYSFPQMFFYGPVNKASSIDNANKNAYLATRVDYKSADGTDLYAWYTKENTKKQIIIFMHGNSYNIESFYHKLVPLSEAGYATFLPEYRGFGDVKGKITQKNLTQDAIAAVKEVHKLGYANKDIIIYGMSLGSHMATNSVYEMGQIEPFEALILEVPFDSLLNTAKSHVPDGIPVPLNYVMKDHYNNFELIKGINTKLLVLGGSNDTTIPISLAKNLFEEANEPKEMIIYQGGKHSDLYNYRNYIDILSWLEK